MQKFDAFSQHHDLAHLDVNHNATWESFLRIAKTEFGPTIFNNWLSGLQFCSLEGGIFVIAAPSKFVREWIIANYFSKIKTVMEQIDKNIQRVDIILETVGASKNSATSLQRIASHKLTTDPELADHGNCAISSHLNPHYTFDNFIVGASNKVAYAAAKHIADHLSPLAARGVLYIHGNVGMGKTHLLHAITQQMIQSSQNIKISYMSAEQFMHQYVMAVRSNEVLTFREKLRSLDMLLVDDLQFICDKSSTQKEFANTLNALMEGGKRVVISCDRSPYLLEIDARTKSRLAGCSVVEIEPADFDLRLQVLTSKAKNLKTKIESNILEFIAGNISSSIREAEGALNRIITHCSLNDAVITVEVSKNILKDCLKAHESDVPMDKIISTVAQSHGITKADILSPSRLSKLVYARQMIASLAKSLTKCSLQEIGKYLGNKDHATIIYYIRQFKLKIERNPKINDEVNRIKDQIQAQTSL